VTFEPRGLALQQLFYRHVPMASVRDIQGHPVDRLPNNLGVDRSARDQIDSIRWISRLGAEAHINEARIEIEMIARAE